jgi:hypothetical protein
MGTVKEVGERIPGITFRVRTHEIKGTSSGKKIGTAMLVAEVNDREMWDRTIVKLDGLRLFAQGMKDEFIDALSEEVDTNANELADTKEALRLSRLVAGQRALEVLELKEEKRALQESYNKLLGTISPLADQLGISLPP